MLELHYGEKHDKSLTRKEQANAEGLSVRETEHHIDVDIFLDGKWEAPIAPSSSTKCSHTLWSKGRRRQNEWSARAANMAS